MGIADDFIEEIEQETEEQELAAIYADPTSLDDAIKEIGHLGSRLAAVEREASVITNHAHSRFMSIEAGYKHRVEQLRALETENAHLRQEIARLKESANKDRDILNTVVEAVSRRER